jgi:hypothetical protein
MFKIKQLTEEHFTALLKKIVLPRYHGKDSCNMSDATSIGDASNNSDSNNSNVANTTEAAGNQQHLMSFAEFWKTNL